MAINLKIGLKLIAESVDAPRSARLNHDSSEFGFCWELEGALIDGLGLLRRHVVIVKTTDDRRRSLRLESLRS